MLPTRKAVRDLLVEATGRAVSLASTEPYAPVPADGVTFGVYVDEHLRTLAVTGWDLALSAYVGAAHATIPVGGVEAELAGRSLSARTTESLRRLLDRVAGLLEPDVGAPARLHAVYPPGVEPPSDVPVYAQTLGRRLDLEVSVSGYGSGRLCLVCPTV